MRSSTKQWETVTNICRDMSAFKKAFGNTKSHGPLKHTNHCSALQAERN